MTKEIVPPRETSGTSEASGELKPCVCGFPESDGIHRQDSPCSYEIKLTRREHTCVCGSHGSTECFEALKKRNEFLERANADRHMEIESAQETIKAWTETAKGLREKAQRLSDMEQEAQKKLAEKDARIVELEEFAAQFVEGWSHNDKDGEPRGRCLPCQAGELLGKSTPEKR